MSAPGEPGPPRLGDEDRHGVVAAFDEHRGLGEVHGDDGAVAPFHCTQIADGTRTVAVGARVRYRLRPGPAGRFEATAIVVEGA